MSEIEQQQSFRVNLPVVRAWEDEAGRMRFVGVASSTRRDRDGDRMTPEALRKMAAATAIPLLPSHKAGHDEALGIVETGWTDGQCLRVAGTLHAENPAAWALVKALEAGRTYALSVGGKILRARRGEEALGGPVRLIEDVELEHIALCEPEEAANPDTEVESGEWRVESVEGEGQQPLSPPTADAAVGDAPPGGESVEQIEVEPAATEDTEPEAAAGDLIALVAELREEVAALREELRGEEMEAEGASTPAPAGVRSRLRDESHPSAERSGGEERAAGDAAPTLQTEEADNTGERPVPLTETGETPVPAAEPGRRRSLPLEGGRGSARQTCDTNNLWKGVL